MNLDRTSKIIHWKDLNLVFVVVIIFGLKLNLLSLLLFIACIQGGGGEHPFLSQVWDIVWCFNLYQENHILNQDHGWHRWMGHMTGVIYRPDTNFSWDPQKGRIMWTMNLFDQGDLYIKFLTWETTKLF